jgi:non-ribosomal peptide synthase protein (TIGR01720 family)
MVPADFAVLERLPLTANGKVDRGALSPPKRATASQREPRTAQEKILCAIFADVIGLEHCGVGENFFEIGGDSIKALQISGRLRQAGWRLNIRDLFKYPEIADLAPRLELAGAASRRKLASGPVVLTPIQRWFFEVHSGNRDHFNISIALRAADRIDVPALQSALQSVALRHDALRLRFPRPDEQLYSDADPEITIETVDLRDHADAEGRLTAHAATLQTQLSIVRGPVACAALYRLATEDRVVMTFHHLVADAVSCRIFIEDLNRAYTNREVFASDTSFQEWAEHLASHAMSEAIAREALHWQKVLATPAGRFPPSASSGRSTYADCRSVEFSLTGDQTARLRTGAPDHDVRSLILTALGRTLRKWHGQDATLILLEAHGREPFNGSLDVSRTIGWFTTLVPFVLRVAGESRSAQLAAVQQDLRSIPRNGIGFGLARWLAPEPVRGRLAGLPLPKLAVNYLGEFSSPPGGDALTVVDDAPCPIDPASERSTSIDVTAVILSKALRISVVYSLVDCTPVTMERFIADYRTELEAIVQVERTPQSQKVFVGVSGDDLAAILRKVR